MWRGEASFASLTDVASVRMASFASLADVVEENVTC